MVEEREYIIPLRSSWMKAANYKRTRKGVMAIKEFIAKHMRVADRDLNKVKLDVYLNNEMWSKGSRSPPSKIKVLAKRDGEFVRVELVDVPEKVRFHKIRQEKRHKASEKKVSKVEEKKETKTEEEVKDEKEKEKSVALLREKQAGMDAKAQKHTIQTESKINTQQKKSLSR